MAELTQAQEDAFTLLSQTFTMYGLGSLIPIIKSYIVAGYGPDTIPLLLRQTDAYKQRFPAMEELSKDRRAISEVDYVNYERKAQELEVQYGLPHGMLNSPTQVKDLLVNHVTGEDLTNRVALNAAASQDAPPELKATLRDYYGIDPDGALTAYYLDPENSISMLQQQMASAKIGAAARRQMLGLSVQDAENYAKQGINEQQAEQAFSSVVGTSSLGQGIVGSATVDEKTRLAAAFGNAEAKQKVEYVQGSRRAQFASGGGAADSQSGVSGLRSSGSR